VRRALLSVTDKTGLVEFARGLSSLGFELLSTGGTARALRDAGLTVIDVAEVTGFPEMLDGRVKTLHPMIHGGLLGDVRTEEHRLAMESAGILPIELLCVNLYAFEKTVSGEHTLEEAIESIDIGGPAMIRAASKNWANVTVVVDPSDYDDVLAGLSGGSIESVRKSLAAKAFRHTAYYDSVIARYLAGDDLTETLTLGYRRKLGLRYGENPHQHAALYVDPLAQDGIAKAEQLWGKELSYNNILDADGAWELVCDMPAGSCAIIKHGNPCGAAVGSNFANAYRMARESDPISAFGGIAAFNGPLDVIAAEAMAEKGNFLEVVIAESFSPEAVEVFKNRSGWGQDVRLLAAPVSPPEPVLSVRSVRGGALVQHLDVGDLAEFRVVTKLSPTGEQLEALRLQWSIVQHVKSNAIVVGTSDRMLGVGAGQMNRVQSVRLALEQAGDAARGAALASDAFFPFPDSIHTAAEAGIAAIVQPGGSKKDADVIAAAEERGIAMVVTGFRHFRH
jgi:phosphoribosylaminoimidazolecarboxamide formyltransferase/IMP cyclohydrolase